MAKILTIERQDGIWALLQAKLSENHCSVDTAPNIHAAIDKLVHATYGLVIWDGDTSERDRCKGLEMIEVLCRRHPETQIIILSKDEGDPLLGRIRSENYHYLRRPIDSHKLVALIQSVLEKNPIEQRIHSYPDVRIPVEFEGMLAVSLAMREVFQRITEAASADVPVLVTGETGTGKDLVAAAIHKRSDRKNRPYVPVHTGAMPRDLIASELFGHEKGAYTGASETRCGFFEQADHGTIFLDEIGTMDERAQISLLRVLETKTYRRVGGMRDYSVDVRVIAATNETLETAIKERRFREDLFYRLDVFRINLPPLRERPWAVIFLTDHFVSLFDAEYKKNIHTVSRETYRCLRRYPWPGNVRELKNVILRAVLMAQGEQLTPDLIPARIREAADLDNNPGRFPIRLGMTLDAAEKEFISMTLASAGGNKKQAASVLGISRRALYDKLAKYGLL